MNLNNFDYEMVKMRVQIALMRKARKDHFIQQVPYRAWFWLLILFSLYLASPF